MTHASGLIGRRHPETGHEPDDRGRAGLRDDFIVPITSAVWSTARMVSSTSWSMNSSIRQKRRSDRVGNTLQWRTGPAGPMKREADRRAAPRGVRRRSGPTGRQRRATGTGSRSGTLGEALAERFDAVVMALPLRRRACAARRRGRARTGRSGVRVLDQPGRARLGRRLMPRGAGNAWALERRSVGLPATGQRR